MRILTKIDMMYVVEWWAAGQLNWTSQISCPSAAYFVFQRHTIHQHELCASAKHNRIYSGVMAFQSIAMAAHLESCSCSGKKVRAEDSVGFRCRHNSWSGWPSPMIGDCLKADVLQDMQESSPLSKMAWLSRWVGVNSSPCWKETMCCVFL